MATVLPIDPGRIIIDQAKATITHLIDGIVELVTNSDESYSNLEKKGIKTNGVIEIYVNRKKGGVCEKLIVKDYAEGMDAKKLLEAIKYGGKTSRFWSGESGRGLWGRGLKETIISLGEGEINTVFKGKLFKTKIWKERENVVYDEKFLNKSESTNAPNGTEIIIKITNEKMRIPETEKFIKQISTHYALRDINSSNNRTIKLIFEELTSRSRIHRPTTTSQIITFPRPEGKKINEIKTVLPGFRDTIKIIIYESPIPLEFRRFSPFGRAGFIIKTPHAILDNRLFKFENDQAGPYFFGEIICLDLEKRMREKGETNILTSTRTGLNWKHDYNRALAKTVEKILEPYISKKRNELLKNIPVKKVNEPIKKMFQRLSNFLNEIAKIELGEDTDRPPEPPPNISDLTIYPSVARVQKNKTRTLLVRAPVNLVEKEGKKIIIETDNKLIYPLAQSLNLEKSSKYPEIVYSGYFKIATRSSEGEATITVKLGSRSTKTKITIADPKRIGPRKPRKGGFISDFKPDNGKETGEMRAVYKKESGLVFINLNSPSVKKFIGEGLNGIEVSDEGKILLSEIVGEVFFRQLARDAIEKEPSIPTDEPLNTVELFISKVNDLQKKYLHKIQEIIINWKF